MGKQVRVFINAKSGNGDAGPEQIVMLFERHGCTCAVTKLKPGLDLAALAKREPLDVDFIAAGGDGTMNAVANLLFGSRRRMGVLALGTLNHFAKDLKLPLELEEAIAVAASEQVRAIDAAMVNGVIFVNNSSLGVYPRMVLDRERMKKSGINKWASLVLASAKAFARFRCLEIAVEVKGEQRRCVTPFLFVGNNEYCMEGTSIGERKRLDQGELSLYLAPGATRATMFRLAFAALFGRVKKEPTFEEFKVKEFTVHVRSRKVRVSLDGEVQRMTGPLNYSIRPRALQILSRAEESA